MWEGLARATVREERLARARDARQGILLSTAFLVGGLLALFGKGTIFVFVTLFGILIAVFGLPLSVSSLSFESGVEGDAMYTARLPIASLWSGRRLGAFGSSEIAGAEVWKEQGRYHGARSIGPGFWVAQTYLVVRRRAGPPARFLLSSSRNPETPTESRRALDWLGNRGIPVMPVSAERDRGRSIRAARIALTAGLVGLALTAVLVVGFSLGSARGLAALIVSGPAVVAIIGISGTLAILEDGSRVSETAVFSYYIPPRAFWDSSEIGMIRPDCVLGASLTFKKARRSALPIELVTIRARGVGKARFNAEDDPEAFEAAVDWLTERGIALARA